MSATRPLDAPGARRSVAVLAVLCWATSPGVLVPQDGTGWAAYLVPVGFLAVALVAVALPWRRLSAAVHLGPAVAVLCLLTLVHVVSSASATTLLLALAPVAWLALHAGTGRTLVAIAGTTTALATADLLGASTGPTLAADLRDTVLFALLGVAATCGVARLTEAQHHRSAPVLDAAVRAVRPTPSDPGSTRRALCRLAAHAAGADQVVLVEQRSGQLVVTERHGAQRSLAETVLAEPSLTDISVAGDVELGSADSPAVRCHRTGRPVWVPITAGWPGGGRSSGGAGASSVLWQPVWGAGRVRAVLAIGFQEQRRELDDSAVAAVRAAATDIGWVLTVADRVAELESAATTDALTGLANRRSLRSHAERAVTGESGRACVLMVDLDRFKAYNDAHGHAAGDDVLVRFARGAERVLRAGELLARWGGEEFVVLLPDVTAVQGVAVADRLRAVVPDGQTCSVGVTSWDGREPLTSALARADNALYAAKASGRDRVVVVDDAGVVSGPTPTPGSPSPLSSVPSVPGGLTRAS